MVAIERRVTKSGKNKEGDIISLCSAELWSPRSKADAISDIESGSYRYYVEEVAPKVYVQVINAGGTKTPSYHGRRDLEEQPGQPSGLLNGFRA